jgi:hypothetical protein
MAFGKMGARGGFGSLGLLGGAGIALNLSASTFPANSALNTVIGTLSVKGGTGSYTYTFTSNPGVLFNISTNQLRVTSTTIAAGSYPVTIKADNGAGSTVTKSFLLTATGGVALKADLSDANANEAWVFW